MKINRFMYFYPERPRLIQIDQPLFQELEENKNVVAELKENGSRLQLHTWMIDHPNPRVLGVRTFEFWNRHRNQMDYIASNEIMTEFAKFPLKGYCLFDGELRHNKTKGVRHKIRLFDVFIWNNELLTRKPFWYRRNILKTFLECGGEPIGIPVQYKDNFRQVYEKNIKNDEIEGLVLKNLNGKLELGRKAAMDSKWMWKVRKPSGRYRY